MTAIKRQDIQSQVINTIADITDRIPSDLNEQTNLLHDLDLDSLALFEIVIDLEAAYDLRISDEEIENLRTIGEIVSFIARRLDQ
ncbi:MAG: acyl carrier protein [Clostridia bacterium]|nr:phosphopantetheine-binding protein [Eubacteriales bacterium]MDD3866680.1 phosphopantetheine-binding protein [Eubacteriales bacterium]MDD4461884.1 phosphopantetheine-binding protein [Eubacteriales bacterium]NCC48457.1 acyl carrier protein [Clostridia bacterium]